MALSKADKERRNKDLEQKAKKRLEARGAPFFGAAEKDVLQMRVQVAGLVQTNNQNVEHIKTLIRERQELSEQVKEHHYMIRSLIDVVVQKELMTEKEINDRIKKRQLNDLSLIELDKNVEVGDIVTIKFKLFDGEKVIDDRTSQSMMYEVGTSGIPCDEQLVGLKKGDQKTIESVIFGPNFKFKEHVGKPLRMELTLCGVHKRDTVSSTISDK